MWPLRIISYRPMYYYRGPCRISWSMVEISLILEILGFFKQKSTRLFVYANATTYMETQTDWNIYFQDREAEYRADLGKYANTRRMGYTSSGSIPLLTKNTSILRHQLSLVLFFILALIFSEAFLNSAQYIHAIPIARGFQSRPSQFK